MESSSIYDIFYSVILNLLDMLHNANKSEVALSYVEVNKVFGTVAYFYLNYM